MTTDRFSEDEREREAKKKKKEERATVSRSTNIKKKARQRGCEKQLRRLFSLLVNYVKHHKRVEEKKQGKNDFLYVPMCV